MGTWGHGDMGTWGHGDMGTWGHGDMGTRGHGDYVLMQILKSSRNYATPKSSMKYFLLGSP